MDDLISRQAVLDGIDAKAWEFCDYLIRKGRNDEQKPVSHFADNLREFVSEELPSVKPQEPTGYWIMQHRKVNTINYRTGEDVLTGEIHTVKELIRYECDEPYCSECGKRAGDTSGNYCCFCGARMESEQNG